MNLTEQELKAIETNEKQFCWWQLCPKCLGQGWVYCLYISTNVTEQCDVCGGAKIIQRPLLAEYNKNR